MPSFQCQSNKNAPKRQLSIGNKFRVTRTFMAYCADDVHCTLNKATTTTTTMASKPRHASPFLVELLFHPRLYASYYMNSMRICNFSQWMLMRPTVCFHANKDLVIVIV